MHKLKIGVLVNPVAGLGGSVGLKGSDDVTEQALALGAVPKAMHRMAKALDGLLDKKEFLELVTWGGDMGESACREAGIACEVLGQPLAGSSPEETRLAVQAFQRAGVDLVLFAGGDGTARDISAVADSKQLFLGVPAGVKIHSGVYAVSPAAATEIILGLVEGGLVEVVEADVRDIDEEEFRHDRVVAKYYASLKAPRLGGFLQHVKSGGREVEDLVFQDIAAFIVENMEQDVYYLMGSGTTVAAVMEELGLANTLLGIDIVRNGELLASDVSEKRILEIIDGEPAKILVTVIGGQGHIFGRGNQQISARVLRTVGRENVIVIASKTKIASLDGRPLIVDTDDEALNREFCGFIEVITGYEDVIVYPVSDGSAFSMQKPGPVTG